MHIWKKEATLRETLKATKIDELIKIADEKGISKEKVDEAVFDAADRAQQLIDLIVAAETKEEAYDHPTGRVPTGMGVLGNHSSK